MTFELIPNPGYEGQTPRILRAACHDRTPFITVRCECGSDMHLHESQTSVVPADDAVISRCLACGRMIVVQSSRFVEAFKQLREEGWIE